MKGSVIIAMLLLALAVFLSVSAWQADTPRPCTPESRIGQACIQIYVPVCGYTDGSRKTYSNSCYACQNEKVIYYTEGECSEG